MAGLGCTGKNCPVPQTSQNKISTVQSNVSMDSIQTAKGENGEDVYIITYSGDITPEVAKKDAYKYIKSKLERHGNRVVGLMTPEIKPSTKGTIKVVIHHYESAAKQAAEEMNR